MFLPSKTGGDGNQQVSNLEKSVSGAENNAQGIARTTLVKSKLNKHSTTVPCWS
jgi:hypothetical protein